MELYFNSKLNAVLLPSKMVLVINISHIEPITNHLYINLNIIEKVSCLNQPAQLDS